MEKLHSVTICAMWFDDETVLANVMVTTSATDAERVVEERRLDLGPLVAEEKPSDTAHALLLRVLDKL